MLVRTHNRSPFNTIREMSQLFDSLAARQQPTTTRRGVAERPPLNVWVTDGVVNVEAELPGVGLDDIEILATRDELTLKGHRRVERPEHATVIRSERTDIDFERTIPLPSEIDVERVSATLNDGVLRISLNTIEAAGPRRIRVNGQHSES